MKATHAEARIGASRVQFLMNSVQDSSVRFASSNLMSKFAL
jgi:hypothetical protein